MLTLQNQVSLSNLTPFRPLSAGSLTARAWNTLCAAVQGVTSSRAVAPVAPMRDGAYRGGIAGRDLPQMRRGIERC